MADRKTSLASSKAGMYLVGVDRSWLYTPFHCHRFRVRHETERDALHRSDIVEIMIDTEPEMVGSITPVKAHLPVLCQCRDVRGQSRTPVMAVDLAGEPEGGRIIPHIRDARVERINVKCILRQVAA